MKNPCEQAFHDLLKDHGIRYTCPDQEPIPHPHAQGRLDFHLTDFGVFVEVKTYSTPRLHQQIATSGAEAEGVIVLIGMGAITAFGKLLDDAMLRGE